MHKLKLNIKKLSADIGFFLYQLFYCRLFKEDELMMVISPTYCQKIFDYLKRVANYLKFVDGNVLESEDKTAKLVLSSVVAYYKKKYVKYAPSRKKD